MVKAFSNLLNWFNDTGWNSVKTDRVVHVLPLDIYFKAIAGKQPDGLVKWQYAKIA